MLFGSGNSARATVRICWRHDAIWTYRVQVFCAKISLHNESQTYNKS